MSVTQEAEPPVGMDSGHMMEAVAVSYMYQCDECYTGGSATCRNGQWTHDGSCSSKLHVSM